MFTTGGYQIIDMKGIAITANAANATTIGGGIYNKIKDCDMPVLLVNLKVGSTLMRPAFVNFQAGTNKFVGTFSVDASTHGLTATIVEITNADKAKVSTVEVAEYSA